VRCVTFVPLPCALFSYIPSASGAAPQPRARPARSGPRATRRQASASPPPRGRWFYGAVASRRCWQARDGTGPGPRPRAPVSSSRGAAGNNHCGQPLAPPQPPAGGRPRPASRARVGRGRAPRDGTRRGCARLPASAALPRRVMPHAMVHTGLHYTA
jgi:hypothetical protein